MAEPGSSDPSSDPSWGKVVLDGCCLYVAGVPKDAEWQELKDHMRQAGEVEYCELLYSDWGQPRGIGFVRFKTEEERGNSVFEPRPVYVFAWGQPDFLSFHHRQKADPPTGRISLIH
ncbi:unnamed protein product [Effrenium voratum]|nr:unnamed protein product [Effrenium voratum]